MKKLDPKSLDMLMKMKGTWTVGHKQCIFSLNKANLHPMKLPVEKHDVKKVEQMAENDDATKLARVSTLEVVKKLSCLETPIPLRKWNPKCSHQIKCDDAVPRALDTMGKFNKVIEFCKF